MDLMNDTTSLIISAVSLLFSLSIAAVMIAGLWKTFEKAGKPGWASIIPIYNIIVMLEIAGLPIWMIVGIFVPCINIFLNVYICHSVSKRFGGGIGMTLLMMVGIGWLIIGFGNAKYNQTIALHK